MVKIELLNNKKPRVSGLFVVICVEVLVLRKKKPLITTASFIYKHSN